MRQAWHTVLYRRGHAVLRRKAILENRSWPNFKRVYRVMKEHKLLLQHHTGDHQNRKHDGEVRVGQSNLRWCSDGFEITCNNKEKVRVAFALDCCDRETLDHVTTTQDTKSLLKGIEMEARTTPVRSPETNGMAEAFVKTFKRVLIAAKN